MGDCSWMVPRDSGDGRLEQLEHSPFFAGSSEKKKSVTRDSRVCMYSWYIFVVVSGQEPSGQFG